MRRLTILFLLGTLGAVGLSGEAQAVRAAKPVKVATAVQRDASLPVLVERGSDQFGTTRTYRMPSGRTVTTRRDYDDQITVTGARYTVTNKTMKGGAEYNRSRVRRVEDSKTGVTRDILLRVDANPTRLVQRERLRDGRGNYSSIEQIRYTDKKGLQHTMTRDVNDDQHEPVSK